MQLVSVSLANAIFIVVLSNVASVMSSLSVPRSSVVLIGDKVEMKCNVTGSDLTTWTYIAWNTSTVTNIYLGEDIVTSMRSRYKIDKIINGHHNLIIDSVDFAHAGRYRCSAAIQKTLWEDIQLTVLGSHPVCAANSTEAHVDGKERKQLTIWCSINYTGIGFPVFSWTKSNAEEIVDATTTSGTSREPLTSTSSITEQLHSNDGGVTLHCQISFQMPNISEENTTNVYEYTWNYTLPYGPKNLSITEYEDRHECSADGNPTPTYRWTDVETNKSTGSATPGVSNLLNTALAIGGSLLFLLIIVLIVSCIVHRKRLKDHSSDRPDVALNTELTSYGCDSRTIADNAVYAEVRKPKGPSKGNNGANIGVKSRPPQTANRETKIVTGADGTVYAELSGVKPPARKGEVSKVPKLPAFSQVEIYAAIDHSGKVPAPPLLQK